MPKRLPTERVPPTDEWGIYDPAKAGMEALFARLGRPVLRGSGKKIRQERRHTFRPERERSAEGVGLAIKEAIDRVGAMDRAALEAKAAAAAPPETTTATVEVPPVPASPARAVRVAVRAAKPAKTPALMLEEAAPQAVAAAELVVAAEPPPAAVKRKAARRSKAETAVVAAPMAEAETAVVLAEPAPKAVRVRKTVKARVTAEPAAAAVIAAPAPMPTAPAPPAPSPRRPRGPVPLAAWAHAVTDAPRPEPRRADQRGFWKGIFRIPSEVALVEYAHGCRIHRLVIETSDELPMLDLI